MKLNQTPIGEDFRIMGIREQEKYSAVWKRWEFWKEPE